MKIAKPLLTAALIAAAAASLQGCFPVVAGGVAVGVLAATDRRTVGTQTEDETIEWKAAKRIADRFKEQTHVNVTSYNRRLLITGEVATEQTKAEIGELAAKVDNVQSIWNELQVRPVSSLTDRSNDAFITSLVKTRFVDASQFAPNRVKVVTEAGSVFLLGLVNEREAKAAIQVASTTKGVRKVVNVLEVLSEEETRRIDSTLAGRQPRPAPAESRP